VGRIFGHAVVPDKGKTVKKGNRKLTSWKKPDTPTLGLEENILWFIVVEVLVRENGSAG